MSGNSYGARCPVCGNEMTVYEDYKPYPMCACECHICGFATTTEQYRLSLSELNQQRLDCDEEEITQEQYDQFKEEDFNI